MGRNRAIGNRLRAGGSSAVALPSTTNMVAWFRKGIGQTNAGGGALSAWADQTGLGSRDYAQATGAAQPAIQAGGTILFDGGSDFLKGPAFALVQPYTRYLRVKQVSWASADYLADGNALNSGVIFQVGTTPNISLSAGGIACANNSLAIGTWGSLVAVFNAGSSVLQIGGTTSTGNPSTTGAGGLTLGAQGDGLAGFANIEVAEEIVYSVAHDATQRAAVIAYLDTL